MKRHTMLLFCLLCAAIVSALDAASHAQEAADSDTSNELIQLVVGLLNEDDKDLRAVGLEQVRSAEGGSETTLLFAAQLQNLKPEAQVGLLNALRDRADSAARPAVLEVLSNTKEESVKLAAVESLGFIGTPDDLDLLLDFLQNGSDAEKPVARASLVRLPGESVPKAMAVAMKQLSSPIQVTLIKVLAERRGLDTIPDLLEAAIGPDPAIRAAAMTALGQLADSDHIPGMLQGVLAAEKGRERESAEKCVMFVCQRTEDKEAQADPVLAAMDKLSEADNTALLSTLGRIGGKAALSRIEAAIASPVSQIHDTGIRALCNWPDGSTAPRLIELVGTDKHPDHQIRALRAIIRIAPLPDGRTDIEKLDLLKKAMPLCTRDTERTLVLERAAAIRIPETLRFLMPYVDQPDFAEPACTSIVELAHHRELREPNKEEFDVALTKVMKTSKDPIVVDRADRYMKNQTWVRPTTQ